MPSTVNEQLWKRLARSTRCKALISVTPRVLKQMDESIVLTSAMRRWYVRVIVVTLFIVFIVAMTWLADGLWTLVRVALGLASGSLFDCVNLPTLMELGFGLVFGLIISMFLIGVMVRNRIVGKPGSSELVIEYGLIRRGAMKVPCSKLQTVRRRKENRHIHGRKESTDAVALVHEDYPDDPIHVVEQIGLAQLGAIENELNVILGVPQEADLASLQLKDGREIRFSSLPLGQPRFLIYSHRTHRYTPAFERQLTWKGDDRANLEIAASGRLLMIGVILCGCVALASGILDSWNALWLAVGTALVAVGTIFLRPGFGIRRMILDLSDESIRIERGIGAPPACYENLRFDQIAAIQVSTLTMHEHGLFDSLNYVISFEVNLVLADPPGERIHLQTGRKVYITQLAERLGRILEVPVLDHS